MSEPGETHAVPRPSRERVDAPEAGRATAPDEIGASPVGVSLGVGLVLVTAMSWAQAPSGESLTLWDAAADTGWQGTVTVLATVLLGLASTVVSMKAVPSRPALRALCGLSLVVIALIGALGSALPDVDTDFGVVEHTSDPARWLAMAAAIALLVTHAGRLGKLRDTA